MTNEVRIPKLGLTMEDAAVVEWHFADGQEVKKGETLLTIETDKIAFDVEAEASGFLQRVAQVDSRLNVGDLAGYLHATPVAASDAVRQAMGEAPGPAKAPDPLATAQPAADAHPAVMSGLAGEGSPRLLISPVARQLAQQSGIRPEGLQGSGPGGVILKRDVLQATRGAAAAPLPAAAVAAMAPPAAPVGVQRRPMSAMRQAISRRMMHSLASTAQMTGFGKVDMGEAVKCRDALVAIEGELGVRISYTDLVLKACACVLAQMPEINSYIDGNDIVTWNEVNLGLAVAVNGGLVVPVIRGADRLSLVEIAQRRQALIERARSGTLTREDVEGGTFTLSNFGSYGGDFETPILNSPQSALLGMGRIADEPAVRDGQIVIRPMMMISLTFDHRLIDGADAGRFRSRLRALLEQPTLMLAHLR